MSTSSAMSILGSHRERLKTSGYFAFVSFYVDNQQIEFWGNLLFFQERIQSGYRDFD